MHLIGGLFGKIPVSLQSKSSSELCPNYSWLNDGEYFGKLDDEGDAGKNKEFIEVIPVTVIQMHPLPQFNHSSLSNKVNFQYFQPRFNFRSNYSSLWSQDIKRKGYKMQQD